MAFAYIACAVTLLFVAVAEIGYRAGTRSRSCENENVRSQVSAVQASTLGLLALLLGFSMSMAESRFAARREVLIAEAGAIETTYLYADGLPEPARSQSRELLRRYVGERRAFYVATAEGADAETWRAERIQAELMTVTSRLAHEHPDWDLSAGYLDRVTEMIRLEAARDLSLNARVPKTIYMLVLIVAIVAIGVSAYASGMVKTRSTLTLYVVPVLIAFACIVIADLDLSRAGFISTGDRPMERLERTMTLDARR